MARTIPPSFVEIGPKLRVVYGDDYDNCDGKKDDIDDASVVTRMRWSTLMRMMLMVMTAM